jgi:two-component system, NarL family, response regulator LiaR
MIRIVIVDDHNMVRSSLATFLDSFEDLEIVGQATSGLEAVTLCDTVKPDVVLMDLKMPEMNGVEAIRMILQQETARAVIALTSFREDDLVLEALQAGAIGYLLKDDTTDELVEAIRDAHAGKPVITMETIQALLRTKARADHHTRHFRLTEREQQILHFMVDGLTNRQIASKLTLSPATIKFHVSSILSKLNAASRTEAVAIAMQHNLIDQ